jgi:hypothetical protein
MQGGRKSMIEMTLSARLAERLPRLVNEWQAHRDELRASGHLAGPRE